MEEKKESKKIRSQIFSFVRKIMRLPEKFFAFNDHEKANFHYYPTNLNNLHNTYSPLKKFSLLKNEKIIKIMIMFFTDLNKDITKIQSMFNNINTNKKNINDESYKKDKFEVKDTELTNVPVQRVSIIFYINDHTRDMKKLQRKFDVKQNVDDKIYKHLPEELREKIHSSLSSNNIRREVKDMSSSSSKRSFK